MIIRYCLEYNLTMDKYFEFHIKKEIYNNKSDFDLRLNELLEDRFVINLKSYKEDIEIVNFDETIR